MKGRHQRLVRCAAVTSILVLGSLLPAFAGEETPAQAGEKVGVEGQFVRVAETDEGWGVLGYGTANESVKKERSSSTLGAPA